MLTNINLHTAVRPGISAVHPDESATLYRSIGQTTLADGKITSAYAPGVAVRAQVQSQNPDALGHDGETARTGESRRFYLFSSPEPELKVQGVHRPLSRGGDMLMLADGTWWLVDALIEDFSRSGWVCVRGTLQVKGPF